MKPEKMKVEVWSDLTCSYCYTAKRKFERALSVFAHKDQVELVWRSFELVPGLQTDPDLRFPQFLAGLQGVSIVQAKGMIDQMADSVKEAGLTYHMYETIPANTFNAHRLSHFAKELHLQRQAEEQLFKAYFTDGKNIDDIPTLIELAKGAGIDASVAKQVMESDQYANPVRQDREAARELGITSIPFFVFHTGETIKGAQDSHVFLALLERSFEQWQNELTSKVAEHTEGKTCGIGGNC